MCPGGSARGHQLERGAGRFIPGFEEQLIGADAGAKLDIKVTFPEDYGAADLAGKDAVFATEVKEIHEKVATSIDDEFAKSFGLEGLDALKGEIRSEEHTSELQSLMRISYAVFCLKKKQQQERNNK